MFNLRAHGTSVRTETLAGCTTFLTMAYIVVLNPLILAGAGIDPGAAFVVTCIVGINTTIESGCGVLCAVSPSTSFPGVPVDRRHATRDIAHGLTSATRSLSSRHDLP
jgi:xanthine/uracil/vitamin C permease (AzgA family)